MFITFYFRRTLIWVLFFANYQNILMFFLTLFLANTIPNFVIKFLRLVTNIISN
jgi:uncharacterized membrane protein YwzB